MNVKLLINLLNIVIHKQHIFVIQNLLKIVQNLLFGSGQKQTSLLLCQHSHWNPDEHAVIMVMLCNFRCSLLIVHLFSITNVVPWLIDLMQGHHRMVALARCYKPAFVFGIERPPNWIRQNYMLGQFRMFQTILRFVRLWYFLQRDEADTAQRRDFLITWRDSTLQLPYHMVYELKK